LKGADKGKNTGTDQNMGVGSHVPEWAGRCWVTEQMGVAEHSRTLDDLEKSTIMN